MKNWKQENGGKLREARKALKEAKKSGDKKAIDAAKLKLQEVQKPRKELRDNFKKQLSEVLSEEQMEKMKKIRKRGGKRGGKGGHHRRPGMRKGPHGGRRPFGKLNLTDEQKAKIKTLKTEAKEKAKSAKTREEKHEIFKNLRETINKDVLTDEQRTKAAKHFKGKRKGHRDKFLKGMGATDEQKAEIGKIMKAAREEAKGKEPKERREIMQAAHENVFKNVLTDDQRGKMRKRRMQWRNKFFDGLGMTKDQRAQANEILAKAEKKAEGKSLQERREIMKVAHKEVHKTVLTDEQREKVKKMKGRWGKGEMKGRWKEGKGKSKCERKCCAGRPGKGRGSRRRKPRGGDAAPETTDN